MLSRIFYSQQNKEADVSHCLLESLHVNLCSAEFRDLLNDKLERRTLKRPCPILSQILLS
jgi:hypothetical protein